ncbi:MAG TPA: hypothetical protein VM759_08370 [Longimicrobium sp.]|nr:hypothetical protein [Longimicrobium sp.]
MDPADDPDPGGPVHPSVFYGLWPRFTVEDDGDEPDGPGGSAPVPDTEA